MLCIRLTEEALHCRCIQIKPVNEAGLFKASIDFSQKTFGTAHKSRVVVDKNITDYIYYKAVWPKKPRGHRNSSPDQKITRRYHLLPFIFAKIL